MKKSVIASAAIVLLAASSASADHWDPSFCFATIESERAVVAPCGDHYLPRIDVYLNTPGGSPFEVVQGDVWLMNESESMAFCGNPTQAWADSSTFYPDPGHTTITHIGGGLWLEDVGMDCTALRFMVIVVGDVIQAFDLHLSSPDLNSDGEVTVADFSSFASLFQSGSACADFNDDGQVSVGDFGVFAGFFNQCECP